MDIDAKIKESLNIDSIRAVKKNDNTMIIGYVTFGYFRLKTVEIKKDEIIIEDDRMFLDYLPMKSLKEIISMEYKTNFKIKVKTKHRTSEFKKVWNMWIEESRWEQETNYIQHLVLKTISL